MCETLAEVRRTAEAIAADMDARTLTGSAAARLLTHATALKNIATSLERDLAARVADCGQWRHTDARSPAEDIARRTGVSVGAARDALDTAERLQELPGVAEAARRGELSSAQTSALAAAAAVAPGEQQRLLDAAKRLPLKELQAECGRTRAAHTDAEANRKRIRERRSLRTWDDGTGTGKLHAEGPVEQIAAIAARINAERDRIFETHRKDGAHESPEAYGFDALVAICAGETSGVRVEHKIIWRLDLPAYLRGYAVDGETCDVAGCPVAVSAVEELMASGSAFMAAVITEGEPIAGVVHFGRAPTAKQQTALERIYPTCAVEGCGQSARLQRDHREDWADTHVTILEFLDLLCAHHHGLKTTKGWRLVEGRGKRAFVPPDDPRHPQHAPPHAA
jgi:hypothetical protein